MQKPKKSLGQNFLKDKNIRNKIINYSDIFNKKIIEIGAGHGFLTEGILNKKPKEIILIEKDKNLYLDLKKKYHHLENIKIFNSDALTFQYEKLIGYNIISNLPYNISTKLILKFFKNNKNFNQLVLMVQKDFAQKIDYNKGKMNKYKFLVNLFSKYEICFDVPPTVFYPKPIVNSSVIRINLNKNSYDWKKLEKFIKILFKSRRKMISNLITINNFKNNSILNKRVEELKFSEILKLYHFF